MHFVILGAGPAGVVAAETIHKRQPKAYITLIGGENEPPYSRMAIPYYLAGNIGEDGTYLRGATSENENDHFSDLDIEYKHGIAEKIDTANKKVTLKDGWEINYDRLLIATGAHPNPPPLEGLDLPGVHPCWTMEDARNIAKLAKDGAPVVLIGAGFIGSIILEALVKAGSNLSVIEMGDRMVPRMMDDTAGNMLKQWCENKGVRVVTSMRVEKISANSNGAGAPLSVTLAGGEKLPAALVVVATGVSPNKGFAQASGLEVGDGIRVDDHMRTSAEHVYAAGDVAEAKDFGGAFSVLAIQPTAVEQGRIAALNMVGADTAYHGAMSMNILDTLGLVSTSFGEWQGVEGGTGASKIDRENFRYLRLEFDEDHLVGAQSLGHTDHVGILRGLIQTKTSLGPWKKRLMEAPERVREAYVALTH